MGKQRRLARLLKADGRSIIVPIDQSFTSGPMPGLENVGTTIRRVLGGRPDAMIMHRGPIRAGLWDPHAAAALVMHLSGGTELSGRPNYKAQVASVEDAVRAAADAVSVHLSLGIDDEQDALHALGRVSSECDRWGMPLLVMSYVYGGALDTEDAGTKAARVAAEIGADVVKVDYPGSFEALARLVEGCFIPVVVAGGPSVGDALGFLKTVEMVVAAGAAGICAGRNVYQSSDPARLLTAARLIVHGGKSADEAWVHVCSGDDLTQPALETTGTS